MPRLAGMALPSGSDTVVYSAPTGSRATVTLNICNTSAAAVLIFVGLCPSGSTSISGSDYIEFQTPLESFGGVIERTGLTPSNQQSIICRASQTGSVAVVWGYTE